jgi:hypothetical protein
LAPAFRRWADNKLPASWAFREWAKMRKWAN